jgi:hypothetical protein
MDNDTIPCLKQKVCNRRANIATSAHENSEHVTSTRAA